MADLPDVLPSFDLRPYSHLLHSLRKNGILVSDLISLDPIQIAKRCPLPLLDVQRLVADVIEALQRSFKISNAQRSTSSVLLAPTTQLAGAQAEPTRDTLPFVSTLDNTIDTVLGGGFPAGHVTEIVGESAVGKTQFVFGLLLAVQLPSPHGLARPAIYIGTEAPLNTRRLEQILEAHPKYRELPKTERPSFDQVHSMTVHDIKAQQSVVENHLPRAVEQYNAGLVVIDSVAANFRAYHNSATSSGLTQRATELIKLGGALRHLAKLHNLAVVVTNQISDRFVSNLMQPPGAILRMSSPTPSSTAASQSSLSTAIRNPKLTLDHQQCFFTGWGNDPGMNNDNMKNPALGLAWANQLSARVVLKLGGGGVRAHNAAGKRRRFVSLVFSPWSEPTGTPVEYAIEAEGIVHVKEEAKVVREREHDELLEEGFWKNAEEDEEFP